MNYSATYRAAKAWKDIGEKERARTLAATYFVGAKLNMADPYDEPDKEYKIKGVKAIVSATDVEEFCPHWQQFITTLPENKSRMVLATLQSRLLVNLTGSILENSGISLEHTCGVPVIPGSAVKGAARRYAIALLQECDDNRKEELIDTFIRIFGCSETDFEAGSDLALVLPRPRLEQLSNVYGKRCGQVCFMQAVPQRPVELCADVLTPHHGKYMSGKNPTPSDDEAPVPSYFPAVECRNNAAYTFTLYAPQQPELLDTAEEWLIGAITQFGIGAKTAAGYGVFAIEDKAMLEFTPEQQKAIKDIIIKKKIQDSFAKFHKDLKKEPTRCWALLRAISLPEEDPACRLKDFRDFLDKKISDKNEEKARKKALEAMFQMAQNYNINLPDIP